MILNFFLIAFSYSVIDSFMLHQNFQPSEGFMQVLTKVNNLIFAIALVCMCGHVCVCIFVCVFVCISVYMHVHFCVYVCVVICAVFCVYVCVYVCAFLCVCM